MFSIKAWRTRQLTVDPGPARLTSALAADMVTPGPILTLAGLTALLPKTTLGAFQNAVWSCPAGGAQAGSCDVVAAGTVPALAHLATVKTVKAVRASFLAVSPGEPRGTGTGPAHVVTLGLVLTLTLMSTASTVCAVHTLELTEWSSEAIVADAATGHRVTAQSAVAALAPAQAALAPTTRFTRTGAVMAFFARWTNAVPCFGVTADVRGA